MAKDQKRWEQSVRWEAKATVPTRKRGGLSVEVCLAAWAKDSVTAATAAASAQQHLLDALNAAEQVAGIDQTADA